MSKTFVDPRRFRSPRTAKAASLADHLADCAFAGLLFSGALIGVLAVCSLLSLVHLV